ncbi:MAG: 5-formyltetrahydrofolate cyclo-ligase [Gallionellaceae bacterium]
MNDIQARKQALRQSIIAARSNIAEPERAELSALIAARLAELEVYRNATTVLGYLNFGAEFSAEIFVRQALADGKQVLLPKVNRETKQLEIYRVTDLTLDVAPGLWEIREPLIERCNKVVDLSSIDFILLPGVAFARDGSRVGYGGGFYDKLLARMPHQPVLVAAAFSMQLIDYIELLEFDRAAQWLITEQETIRCETALGITKN